MYKLIAIDLDGTLLNEKKEISERCLECIKEIKKMGKKVVIATGRPLHGIRPYLKKLELIEDNNYTVVYNGAQVVNATGKVILFEKPVSVDAYRELYELSKQFGVYIHAIINGGVLTPRNNPYTGVESSLNHTPVYEGPVENVDPSTKIIKVMFVDEPRKLDAIIPLLPKWVKEKYTVFKSADIFLEFINKGVDKGVGVSVIANHFGIRPQEVICVGDAGNDIAMIRYAGLGVAMGNATEDVKAEADYITLTNEEDGVAHVIEKFML